MEATTRHPDNGTGEAAARARKPFCCDQLHLTMTSLPLRTLFLSRVEETTAEGLSSEVDSCTTGHSGAQGSLPLSFQELREPKGARDSHRTDYMYVY